MRDFSVNRRTLLASTGTLAASAAITLAIGGSWTYADERPAMAFLGSGSSSSLLVKSGGARLLILSGTNSADFANALSNAMRPGNPRIDLLIIPGSKAPIALAERAHRVVDPRLTIAFHTSAELTAAQLPINETLLSPRRIEFPNDVSVELFPESDSSWWAIVQRGPGHALILSDDSASNPRSLTTSPALIAQLRGKPSVATLALKPAALVVSSAALSGPDGRQALLDAGSTNSALLRVFSGDAVVLGLSERGITLPG